MATRKRERALAAKKARDNELTFVPTTARTQAALDRASKGEAFNERLRKKRKKRKAEIESLKNIKTRRF